MYIAKPTIENELNTYRPVVAFERMLPRRTLSRLRTLLFVFFIASVAYLLVTLTIMPTWYHERILGLVCILGALWLEQYLLYAYHNSFYFRGLDSIIASSGKQPALLTYDAATVILSDPRDVTAAFFRSTFGTQIALRSNLDPIEVEQFLQQPRETITSTQLDLPTDVTASVISLLTYVIAHDTTLRTFLKEQAVSEEHCLGAARFVMSEYHNRKRRERWWSRDNLSKRGGLGRNLSYGTPYELERFSRNLFTSAVFANLTTESTVATKYITEVEQILARSKNSNVLLLGNPGVGKMDILITVQRRLENGQALNALSGQQLIILDTERLLAGYPDGAALEAELMTILDQAAQAGNITLVIENISYVIAQAAQLGVAIPELLDEYLALPSLHIVCTDTPGAFHTKLAPLGAFTRRFEEILVEAANFESTIALLQPIALTQEGRYGVLFTYEALTTIASAADRYITEGVMPDKAISLLIEVAEHGHHKNQTVLNSDIVYEYVSTKTGIPTGPINDEERDRLLHIEDILHTRVIGQTAAVTSVARTMRRARVDIERADKPIGSFLFLGPTGVGKTETAKALAAVFFGNEEAMVRFDMSEFSGGDALARLIGDNDTPGLLANALREHPYTVLLLDEFEKATTAVHDLFLQILDEGNFTDALGEKVNARNTIIIATSNAGSDLISRTKEVRQELTTLERDVINHIIKQGIFRPELINRFDGTILFDALTQTEQAKVASLMIRDLTERVQARGYTLVIEPAVMDLVTRKGYDPQFGARPMQRVIQNLIEEKIAQQIIAGTVKKGDTITLTRSDFSDTDIATA